MSEHDMPGRLICPLSPIKEESHRSGSSRSTGSRKKSNSSLRKLREMLRQMDERWKRVSESSEDALLRLNEELKERCDELYEEAHYIFQQAYEFAMHQLLNSTQPQIDWVRKTLAKHKTALREMLESVENLTSRAAPEQEDCIFLGEASDQLDTIEKEMGSVSNRTKWLKGYGQSLECRLDFHKHLRDMFNKQSCAELSSTGDITQGASTTLPESTNSSCLLSSISTAYPKQSHTPHLLTFDPVNNSLLLFNLQSKLVHDRIEIEDIDLPQGFQCAHLPRKGVILSGGRRLASNLASCHLLSIKESYEVGDLFTEEVKRRVVYSQTCIKVADMGYSRSQHAMTVCQEKYVFTAGAYRDAESAKVVERYDSEKNSWERFGELNVPRWGAAIVALENMYLYVIAGYDCQEVQKTNSIEYLDTMGVGESARRWRILQYADQEASGGWTPRANCGAMQLCYDKLLIFGGGEEGDPMNDCFLFETHTFRIDKMNTTLAQGDVFGVNGCSWGDNGLASIEGGGGGFLRCGSKFFGVSGSLKRAHWLNIETMQWESVEFGE